MLIKKYVNTGHIEWIIGHNPVVYVREATIMVVILFLLYVGFALLNHTTPTPYWRWIFGGIGILLFIKWLVDFLNLYLDCLILTKESATLFLREGWLEYKTEIF